MRCIRFKSKGNLKVIRQDLQDLQDLQDIPQRQYPVNPVNPVKIPCFLKWIPCDGETHKGEGGSVKDVIVHLEPEIISGKYKTERRQ